LRFRHLQFLDILGQTRNLRLASEWMHITQPAATKMLMEIETILNARLFDRLSRGVAPNELGLFTLHYANGALEGHRKFAREFDTLRQGGAGHLTIGAISGSAHLLMSTVSEVQRLRPLLVLKMLEQSSDQLALWLAERKIDLMIGRFTNGEQQAQFRYERLSAEPLQVVARVDHPLRGRRIQDLAELTRWPWILYPSPTALRRVTDDIFSSIGLTPTSGVVETPSFWFSLELLQTTQMLSLQPASLAEEYARKGLLTRIQVELPDRMPDYGLITHLGETLSPSAQAFVTVLREKAGVEIAEV
jgi:DNA-binding transcriptional LysR family regulator